MLSNPIKSFSKSKKDKEQQQQQDSDMSVRAADNKSLSDSGSIKEEKNSRPKTTHFAVPDVTDDDIREREEKVRALDAKDMKVKFRIRVAKCFIRCLSFGCSLVVLALIASAFQIFFATRHLANRNNLPPWAPQSVLWPAIVTICIAGISLCMAIYVLISYWRGGHRKAEKAAIWFTAFSIGGFLLMIILWGIVAGVLSQARNNSEGRDMWEWSCKDNTRKELFQNEVNYDLVCRQMDWAFVCAFIDISIEILAILLYAAAFWRFASKSKLRKSMDCRDQARKSMYAQKLRDGDEDAYRREDGGDGYKKPEAAHHSDINSAEEGYSSYSYAPPPPAPMHAGSMPIIDPNSGLAINPATGEAVKPSEYRPHNA